MGKILVNTANGQSDYYGTLLPLSHYLNGQVIKGLNVTENSPVGMSVLVQPGSGQILEGTGASQFGRFIATDSTTSVTITTANGANPRIDVIVAYYDTGTTPSGVNNPNMLLFAAVAGTPAGSPAAPNDAAIQSSIGSGKPFIKLAQVLVGTSVTTITNSNISDKRSFIAPQGTSGYQVLGATPSTVTANGNHSTDLTFTGVDLTSTLSEGMRLRATRTVPTQTQVTKLNGTNQYWNNTSPAGMTFTDDFVVSAWVKLSSYSASVIAGRYNGTSGWRMTLNSSGQVFLIGYNGGAGNTSYVSSYQSIPLNKWVHVTAQLDMSTFTATMTTSYVMIDGVDVPVSVARTGTNPTALIQAGNLEIGSYNGGAGEFFPGKIAQVAIFNSKVTQATILASMNQGLSGSEPNLISAWKFDGNGNSIGTSNNLTAQGSVTATEPDSPFGNSGASADKEYAIVMSKPVYSGGNTTMTVRTAEGNTIPTSGGVSSVDYSSADVPFGFPNKSKFIYQDANGWEVTEMGTYKEFRMTSNQPSITISASDRTAFTNIPLPAGYSTLAGLRIESLQALTPTFPGNFFLGALSTTNGSGTSIQGFIGNNYAGGALATGNYQIECYLRTMY